MKILVVCDQGNNRSVTLAGQLKYLGNDVLTVGTKTNSEGTLFMLGEWADRIIVVSAEVELDFHPYPSVEGLEKIEVWDLGPDVYPRPYNTELLVKVKQLIKDHPQIDQRSPLAKQSDR